jgi:hypothetical protein
MRYYRAAQRKVAANIYTPRGWLFGTFHVGEATMFLDAVNNVLNFFKLTDVELMESEDHIPFFALQRDSAMLIIPNEHADRIETAKHSGDMIEKEITVMLEMGMIHGTVRMLPDLRFSDFLLKSTGFFVMRNCISSLWENDPMPSSERPILQYVLVNARRVLGASESEE